MIIRRLYVVIVLLAVNAEARSAFRPPPSLDRRDALDTALTLRGGAGPLDATKTAKFSTILNLANAGVTVLAPKLGCKAYGMPQGDLLEYQIESFGATLLSIAVASYCLLFHHTSVNQSFGFACFPFIIQYTKELLNDKPRELGIPIEPSIIGLTIAVVSARALLTNSPHATRLLKYLSIWNLSSGTFLALVPKIAGQAWGVIQSDAPDLNVMLVKLQGYFNVALGILVASIVTGVNVDKAVGYSWIPYLVCSVDVNFVGKQVDKFGLRKDPQFVWLLVMMAFVVTLTL